MAVNPKLLSRVGNYLRGGPTEREESRTDALAAIESDLAGADDIGVKEDLSSYLLDDIKFGDASLSNIRELTPDEKRDAVVSKHEDNDNYEAWSPKGDPWSYELIAGESASESYIIATNAAGKEFKVHASSKPKMFEDILVTSPSAIAAGFGKEEATSAAAVKAPGPTIMPDMEIKGDPDADLLDNDRYGVSEKKARYGEYVPNLAWEDRLYSNESEQEAFHGAESAQEPFRGGESLAPAAPPRPEFGRPLLPSVAGKVARDALKSGSWAADSRESAKITPVIRKN